MVPLLTQGNSSPLRVGFYGVGKEYHRLWAVEELTLEVKAGEIFGLLGPNGAGKTTILKMGAGLVKPTRGKIIICDKDLHLFPEEAKRLVGFVPDQPYLYESLTGREFMYFCAGLYELNGHQIPDRVAFLFDLFGISSWADQRCGEYSHGMRQRLVMASAFLHSPALLLVDEPMVGLDPAGIRLLKQLFNQFSAQGGAVILSTHTLSDAEELCHRVGIIHRGKLVATYPKEELVEMGQNLETIFLELTSS